MLSSLWNDPDPPWFVRHSPSPTGFDEFALFTSGEWDQEDDAKTLHLTAQASAIVV